MRHLLLFVFALLAATPALAREQISRFDVTVTVQRSGAIEVTERLAVVAEGDQIRRGIFRDLPRYFERGGQRYRYDYHIAGITRDGRDEPYETSTEGGAYRIRIGDPDYLLPNGEHIYELRYSVRGQVRYFADYDEIYWNATGNYWAFPILAARAVIVLPPGAQVTQTAGYTGALGETGAAFSHRAEGDRQIFETTAPLAPGQGLTVAVGFAKGLIDPPSAIEQGALLWQRYGALGILLASFAGVFFFLYRNFQRVGRDPPKGPVFPRYQAPRGLSPAAVHTIYHRMVAGNRALIATLMNLAVRGRLTIDASDKERIVLSRSGRPAQDVGVPAEDAALEAVIFRDGDRKTLGGAPDTTFTAAYVSYQTKLGRAYGAPYFRWNVGYSIAALALTVIGVAFALTQVVNWSIWHTLLIIVLAGLNFLFMYLMPAPTPIGQELRTEIEGFKLYMETAEKLQINAAQPGSEAPPMMTKERYERFLPYAVALGVEAPWTRYFERVLPQEAASYRPGWTNMGSATSMTALSSAIVANMNSGVSSAMPQSSGSSGSGGGGSSGGGGGGGGGGGW
ncbi:MAG: DUF2207 domain-containing protein [Hyphomonadaceae bacterium]|nr:DUF2207 domain-containing protein [Hyphomonadaceae bacterium]